MIIITVNGAPGCGKSTFESYCEEVLTSADWECHIVSTIDFVKGLARQCGWNGEKTAEARKFLSDFKAFLSDTYLGDITFNKLCEEFRKATYPYGQFEVPTDKVVFFVDAREPKQLERFSNECNAVSLVIRNEKAEAMATSNTSDSDVLDFDYNWSINNDGTLAELKQKAHIFTMFIRSGDIYKTKGNMTK